MKVAAFIICCMVLAVVNASVAKVRWSLDPENELSRCGTRKPGVFVSVKVRHRQPDLFFNFKVCWQVARSERADVELTMDDDAGVPTKGKVKAALKEAEKVVKTAIKDLEEDNVEIVPTAEKRNFYGNPIQF